MKQIAGVDSNQFKLLLVDDIPLNLLLLEKMLQPFEFQIAKASNGRFALQMIQDRQDTPDQFDLAIVDLMMPDIDGFQVIKSVRKGCDNADFHIHAMNKGIVTVLAPVHRRSLSLWMHLSYIEERALSSFSFFLLT